MVIKTKQEMYKLYQLGRFGNKLRFWPNLGEFLHSGFTGEVGLRYSDPRMGGGLSRMHLCLDEVAQTIDELVTSGRKDGLVVNPGMFSISEMAPHADHGTINGEIRRSIAFYDLRYSLVRKPMRDALAEQQSHASGLAALSIVRHFLDTPSQENLMFLLDEYDSPDTVVEFSSFDISLGDCNWNTVFWEVRSY